MKRENARDGVCFLCGRDGTEDPLDFHHIFGGNAADAPVAQLDRVLDSDSKGHRFESCRVRHF